MSQHVDTQQNILDQVEDNVDTAAAHTEEAVVAVEESRGTFRGHCECVHVRLGVCHSLQKADHWDRGGRSPHRNYRRRRGSRRDKRKQVGSVAAEEGRGMCVVRMEFSCASC